MFFGKFGKKDGLPVAPPLKQEKREYKKFNISTITDDEIREIFAVVGDKKKEEISDKAISNFRDSFLNKGEYYVNEIDAKFYIVNKEEDKDGGEYRDGDIVLAYSNRPGAKKNAEEFGMKVM